MAARIITPEDCLEFKQELFQELQKLFAAQNSSTLQKKWLKSPEVRELLGVSPLGHREVGHYIYKKTLQLNSAIYRDSCRGYAAVNQVITAV